MYHRAGSLPTGFHEVLSGTVLHHGRGAVLMAILSQMQVASYMVLTHAFKKYTCDKTVGCVPGV